MGVQGQSRVTRRCRVTSLDGCAWCGAPITGTALTWAQDIDTDGRFPARYCTTTCMDSAGFAAPYHEETT